ncbi:MAG: DUF177 domain-containing protein [Synergistaceae bacterium]|nr:DUF177 domain-containing protein [Synergistaceae bacterium]
MAEFIKAAPKSWHHRLIIPAIPKDGMPYTESFSLSADRKINYWEQLYLLTDPLQVKVEAYRAEGRIIAVISISGSVTVPCSRCLEPAGVAIEGELRYLFSLDKENSKKNEPDHETDADEELMMLDSWEDEIDLGPLVWEVLITLLPTAPLCSEECRGLCPKCGANLNNSSCTCTDEKGDPRFEVLKSLMQKEQHK